MTQQSIPAGANPPFDVNAVIEIPAGCSVKYEMDKALGVLRVDRFLLGAMHYPANYGYIPGTLSADGDPCDILVLETPPLLPGSLIACRPIGVLLMEDEAGHDEKILAVPIDRVQPRTACIRDVEDLPPGVKEAIMDFFQNYKRLEKDKWVKADCFLDVRDAERTIAEAIRRAGGTCDETVRIEE